MLTERGPPSRARSLRQACGAVGHHRRPPPIASPWQNDFAERLIGSIQRECVDYIIVLREAHLRRILQAYA
ncbi:MAG: hypothetical protein WA703_17935, partial [Pseudolabrys sp.]